jgi:hypothetical protein
VARQLRVTTSTTPSRATIKDKQVDNMAKSKLRGGAKQHRKRVEARNQKQKRDYETAAKLAWSKFEQWKKERDGGQDNQGISITTTEQ